MPNFEVSQPKENHEEGFDKKEAIRVEEDRLSDLEGDRSKLAETLKAITEHTLEEDE